MTQFTAMTAAQLEAAIADLSTKTTARAARHLGRTQRALAKLQGSVAVAPVEVVTNVLGLTEASSKLFNKLCKDYHDWSGQPLIEESSLTQNGTITDLKKKGLIQTAKEDGCIFAIFTDKGREAAKSLGYTL